MLNFNSTYWARRAAPGGKVGEATDGTGQRVVRKEMWVAVPQRPVSYDGETPYEKTSEDGRDEPPERDSRHSLLSPPTAVPVSGGGWGLERGGRWRRAGSASGSSACHTWGDSLDNYCSLPPLLFVYLLTAATAGTTALAVVKNQERP